MPQAPSEVSSESESVHLVASDSWRRILSYLRAQVLMNAVTGKVKF